MVAKDEAMVARPKGRPRDPATGEAITEATLDLIAEIGSIDALSIEAIAARAGVGKATIYRRWPNKEALVIDAVGTMKGVSPPLKGVSIREDLADLARVIRRSEDTREGRILPCLTWELKQNPELARRHEESVRERRERVHETLRRGIANGELRDDIDVETVGAMFLAPLMMVAVFGSFPNIKREGLADRVIDSLLDGIAKK
ncbi:TetR/AcrR family transcriptional regulator [Stackebrandtia sp.]|jgi:AcrR family transcriptional regulator|uniref:TetR/AcrR family transcriptional regulator n=1 Tax=Stackebrandtia sp. TaxID=2023065 RepID=UPI002D76F6C7|nr:TetR/AcrR family transcriptional regulator [Stackebrandtia sp.]